MRHTTAILCVLLALLSAGPRTMAAALRPGKTASWGPALQILTHARPAAPQVLDRVPETTPRDYEPAPGRPKWLNRDPIGEKGGWNLYAIVDNDVVNFWDLLGLKACKVKSFKVHSLDPNNPLVNGKRDWKQVQPAAAGQIIPQLPVGPNFIDPNRQQANFKVDVEFEKPDCGCCVYRQYVSKSKKDPFKIDLDASGGMYGDRSASASLGFDAYYDNNPTTGAPVANQPSGCKYNCTDVPSPLKRGGDTWVFKAQIIDVCNGDAIIESIKFAIPFK